MPWFELMTLADGLRVESNVPSWDEINGSGVKSAYRVTGPDGSAREFPTLRQVLAYLTDQDGLVDPVSSAARERR